jgi:DNA-binding transcriptional MerR regulator
MPERSLKLLNRDQAGAGSESPVEIPDKLFFSIGEVCRLLKLEPYVLRFWESEFPRLKPGKGANGRRMYRKRDIEMVLAIKHLLYEKGFTIAGARKALSTNSVASWLAPSSQQSLQEPATPQSPAERSINPDMADTIRVLKSELRAILTILNGRC